MPASLPWRPNGGEGVNCGQGVCVRHHCCGNSARALSPVSDSRGKTGIEKGRNGKSGLSLGQDVENLRFYPSNSVQAAENVAVSFWRQTVTVAHDTARERNSLSRPEKAVEKDE